MGVESGGLKWETTAFVHFRLYTVEGPTALVALVALQNLGTWWPQIPTVAKRRLVVQFAWTWLIRLVDLVR